MGDFLQLHFLTSYPPANLNRDDLGRPKTAVMGGAQRLRISSQSLKRAWRTSDSVRAALDGHLGTRTKDAAKQFVQTKLVEGGIPDKEATEWARAIAERFGKLKGEGAEIEQLAHLAPKEVEAIQSLATDLLASRRPPTEEDLGKLLQASDAAVDIALFGRMLAASPRFNVEAACQVAHAISVHKVAVEDDYFTAVDDLNRGDEDMGAGHIGETEFAAGLFYLYICVDRALLVRNLGGNEELAARALRAFVEAAVTVAPTGKQNSFASRAYASYALAEKGTRQPRSLSVAFLKPVAGNDMLETAITTLKETRDRMDAVYGPLSDVPPCEMNAAAGKGKLTDLLDFVAAPLPHGEGPA